MLMNLALPAPAGRGPRAPGGRSGPRREGSMPRSFLVKTHLGHRVPNYGRLETQRGRGCPLPRPRPGLGLPRGGREGRPRELGHLSQVEGEESARQHGGGGRDPGAGGE